MAYKPMMSEDEVKLRKDWHDNAYVKMEEQKKVSKQYLGRKFLIPKEVFPPAPMSKLLGKTVLEEVRESDRVLDMGTGSGVNAILAASKSSDVVAVDVNPFSVECGKHNARLNNVSSRIEFLQSDLFENVSGKFDLIIFDPPFRWFVPRDIRERAVADENFSALRAFFERVKNYLRDGGRILIFYGDTGDMNYLIHLMDRNGFEREILRKRALSRNNRKWMYYTWRLHIK